MKKLFILLFIILSTTVAFADYMPAYVNPSFYYGNGLISLDDSVLIYDSDNDNANVIASVTLDNGNIIVREKSVPYSEIENTFLAVSNEKKIMLMPVEYDTDDWYYVCYNQKMKLFGWIKKTEKIDYMSWSEFFNLYGRKYGIYLFRNINPKNKVLYSSSDIKSTKVDEFSFPKHTSLWLISKDWMLVKITTYDGETKTGWLKWRLDNGSIIAFPDLR